MPTTLLAVDDSVTMRKVLELTFAGEDFRVVPAESGEAALNKLRLERPDIALVDISLEGTNGYGVCGRMKTGSPGTPVILMSSKQQPYDASKGGAAKADDFIEKPFDTQQLIDKVKKVLAARGSVVDSARQAAPTVAAPSPAAAPVRPAAPAMPVATAPAAPRAAAPTMHAASSAGASTTTRPQSGFVPPVPSPDAQLAPPRGGTLAYIPPMEKAAPHGATVPSGTRPTPAAAMAPSAVGATTSAAASASSSALANNGSLSTKLGQLGLTEAQVQGVLALSREVIERVVWEVVPSLAETMIREEIKRLTAE